jgi:hypothetical protein
MNCDKCLFLTKENKCLLGKHYTLAPIIGEGGRVEKLSRPCIFKNETYQGLNYKQAHAFAKTRIAVAVYFVINELSDISRFQELMDKEKLYDDNVIGEVNVIVNNLELDAYKIKDLAMYFSSSTRLWNIISLFENQWEENSIVNVPQYILDTCKLPYFVILNGEEQFGQIKTFEAYSMTMSPPFKFEDIYSVNHLRKTIEILSESENAQFQA